MPITFPKPTFPAATTDDVKARSERFEAMYMSSQFSEEQLIAFLDTNTISTEMRNGYGNTPLIMNTQRINVTKKLLELGADVNAQNDQGMTALQSAVRRGEAAAIALFIAHGADVNIADKDGKTALIIAERLQDTAAADLLRAAGAVETPAPLIGQRQNALRDR